MHVLIIGAGGMIGRKLEEAMERIVAGWPQSFQPSHAAKVGFVAESTVDELIAVYLSEDAPRAPA